MGAQWSRNAVDPLQRLAKLIINADGFTLAPRGTDFMTLGIVFLGVDSTLVLAAGTMTNDRHPYQPAAAAITATNVGTNTVTFGAGHPYETGDGPINPDATGGNLDEDQGYYAIVPDPVGAPNDLQFAATLADAYVGTAVDITADITGVNVGPAPGCMRGIDGHFTYTGTQAESDQAVAELGLYVEGTGYRAKNGGGTFTSISFAPSILAEILEGDVNVGDGLRIVVRGEAAPYTVDADGNYIIYSLDGTKISHKGKITPTGRTLAEVVDPT